MSGCNQDREAEKWPNGMSIIRRVHTIMSPEAQVAGKRSFWPELEISGPICNLSPALWKLSHLTCLYLNDNNLSVLPSEISHLSCLIHLDVSSNKLRSLPPELGDLRMLRELLLNNNYLRMLPYEIGKLFLLQNLGLNGNPLAPEIISLYNEANGTQKLLSYFHDNLIDMTPRPPQREWITVSSPDRTHPNSMFTVMCYNILCNKYATRQLYGYCPNWALSWEYRKKGITEEIRSFAADIICLQEVETEQYYEYFLPELKRDGYDGLFSPKSRAKTMSENERKHVDGCAIFFRTSKFLLLDERLIEFNQLAMANAEGSYDMLNRVMTKDNIGLAAILQTKDSTMEMVQPLLVCNAHIHWDPEFCDVKLIQTMMLMNELCYFLETSNKTLHKLTSSHMPILLCGDFNSLPDSGVIEFLSNGRISTDHADFKNLGYKDCLRKLNNGTHVDCEYTHPFKISRCYDNLIMPYTNYTFYFKGKIDYIFFSKPHMKVLGLLGPVSLQWIDENKIVGCPHQHIPSDHFSLLVELQLSQSVSNGIILHR